MAAGHLTHFYLVPAVAIVHQYPVGLDDQDVGGGVHRLGWLLSLEHARRRSLLALDQCDSHLLGMRPHRLDAQSDASQPLQPLGCLAKGQLCPSLRYPRLQARTEYLMRCQLEHHVGWHPTPLT